MLRRLALRVLVLVACALVAWAPGSARACMNATVEDDPAIVRLREAEAALGAGDVFQAREKAREAARLNVTLEFRAKRLVALSFVRDAAATDDDLDAAVTFFAAGRVTEDPAYDADYGEALERAGRTGPAYDLLAPLVRADLVGSPYALAATSRAARARGDEELSRHAVGRCEIIAESPSLCHGVYPSKPWLRASPGALAGLGLVLLGFFGWRWQGRGDVTPRPWHGYGERARAASVLAAGAPFALGWVSAPVGVALLVGALVTGELASRRLFLRAARRGAFGDHRIRALDEGDAGAPELRLFFGPSPPEILEALREPTYRDAPRAPVLKLTGRKSSPAILVAVMVAVTLAFLGANFFVLARGGEDDTVRREPPALGL